MVGSAWLPYDEARLYTLLHSDRAQVDAWLDDHRTLGQLAPAVVLTRTSPD